jgi:hypothetical protein
LPDVRGTGARPWQGAPFLNLQDHIDQTNTEIAKAFRLPYWALASTAEQRHGARLAFFQALIEHYICWPLLQENARRDRGDDAG